MIAFSCRIQGLNNRLIHFLDANTELLESVLQQQLPGHDGDAANFRARLGLLLFRTVAEVDETKLDGTRPLHFTGEQDMSFYPFIFDHKNYQLRGQADYAVWYGRGRDIDSNLVVIERAKGGSPGEPT